MNEARLASFMKKLPKDIIDEYNAATAQAAAEKQTAAAAAGKSSASGSGSGSNGRGWRPWVTAAAVLATVAIFFVAGVLISMKIRADKHKASVSATDDLTSQSATPTEDALLTLEYIRSTEPYKCFSWSETYSEQAGGFLSADGVPLDFAALLTEAPLVDEIDSSRPEKLRFVAGEKAAIKRIRTYTTGGEFIYEFFNQNGSDFVSVAENELLTRDITDNAAVIPDECFVVVEVSKTGTYYPEFDRSESFGWNCVFRFRYAGGNSSATAGPLTPTPEFTPTPTVAPTATATPTNAPTATLVVTPTPTLVPTAAPTPTPVPTPSDDISNYLHFELAQAIVGDGNYELFGSDKYAILTGIDQCTFKSVTIPDSYQGYPVKSIFESQLFKNIKKLEYVSLPDSIVTMSTAVFMNCKDLKEVKLPANLIELPASTFQYCSNLTKVTMPNSPKKIGDKAFFECSSFNISKLPDSVISIGKSAFEYCTGITKMTLHEGVELIGANAFHCCTNLTEIVLPDTLKRLEGECFGTTGITSIVIPKNKLYPELPTFESTIFANCKKLTTVSLPDNMTAITWQMFAYCVNLQVLTIPESVTRIESSAFSNCGAEAIIKIGKNVSYIDNNAFTDFKGTLIIDPENPYYTVKDGVVVKRED